LIFAIFFIFSIAAGKTSPMVFNNFTVAVYAGLPRCRARVGNLFKKNKLLNDFQIREKVGNVGRLLVQNFESPGVEQ
jgi:hypothetical protein